MGLKDMFGRGNSRKLPAGAKLAKRRRRSGSLDEGYTMAGQFYLLDGTCPSDYDYSAPAYATDTSGSNGSYGGSDYGDQRSSYDYGSSGSGSSSSYGSSSDSGYSSGGGGYSSGGGSSYDSGGSSSSSSSDSGSY